MLRDAKLRDVLEVLDAAPVFSAAELALLTWAADYYHHPVGEVFAAALPRLLRAGHDAIATRVVWSATEPLQRRWPMAGCDARRGSWRCCNCSAQETAVRRSWTRRNWMPRCPAGARRRANC